MLLKINSETVTVHQQDTMTQFKFYSDTFGLVQVETGNRVSSKFLMKVYPRIDTPR